MKKFSRFIKDYCAGKAQNKFKILSQRLIRLWRKMSNTKTEVLSLSICV
jgi:hypothetical protein